MLAINEENINNDESNSNNNDKNSYSSLMIQQSNDQNNNNLLVNTSIFTLENSNTANMQQLNSNHNLNFKINDQLPSTSMQLTSFCNDNWPHSKLKPASRFSISTRRECKVNNFLF